MSRLLTEEPLPITHLELDEIAELHDGIAGVLERIGMKGMPLDRALSAAFRAAVVEVQAAREFDEQRRANLRPV